MMLEDDDVLVHEGRSEDGITARAYTWREQDETCTVVLYDDGEITAFIDALPEN